MRILDDSVSNSLATQLHFNRELLPKGQTADVGIIKRTRLCDNVVQVEVPSSSHSTVRWSILFLFSGGVILVQLEARSFAPMEFRVVSPEGLIITLLRRLTVAKIILTLLLTRIIISVSIRPFLFRFSSTVRQCDRLDFRTRVRHSQIYISTRSFPHRRSTRVPKKIFRYCAYDRLDVAQITYGAKISTFCSRSPSNLRRC